MGWWDGSYPLDCEAKNDPQEIRVGFSHNFAFFLVDFPWATFLKGPGGVWRHVARRGGRLETKLDLDRDSASVPGSRTLPRRFEWNHEDLNIKEIQARLPVETIFFLRRCKHWESFDIGMGFLLLMLESLGKLYCFEVTFIHQTRYFIFQKCHKNS